MPSLPARRLSGGGGYLCPEKINQNYLKCYFAVFQVCFYLGEIHWLHWNAFVVVESEVRIVLLDCNYNLSQTYFLCENPLDPYGASGPLKHLVALEANWADLGELEFVWISLAEGVEGYLVVGFPHETHLAFEAQIFAVYEAKVDHCSLNGSTTQSNSNCCLVGRSGWVFWESSKPL